MTYRIILRYLFIGVLRIVPFVQHHEPSNERGLELSACVQCLDEDFQAVCLSKLTTFSPSFSISDSFMTLFSLWTYNPIFISVLTKTYWFICLNLICLVQLINHQCLQVHAWIGALTSCRHH